MRSRGRTEESKNGQKHDRMKEPKDHNQSRQNPPKWENILILQQSRCTIPWSPDTGVENQHSRHAITWVYREKQKWTKAPQNESQKRIRIKAEKTPKNEKIFEYSNNQGARSHDHMIQVWTINILIMQSRGRTEKSKNGQKRNRTKTRKGQNQSGKNPQKWENILILQQSSRTIPWSHDTGGGQRKAKVDKSTTGPKPKKDHNQSGQNPQKWKNILIPQQSRCTNPWSPDTGVHNQHSCHAITWADREKQKWRKAPQDESQKRIRIKEDKTPKNEKIF